MIDPVFLHSPQFLSEPLSDHLGVATIVKVESVNPIRSFKGRGASFLVHQLDSDQRPLVCASAGNFGQGMAYACRAAGKRLTVFAGRFANSLKLERMRALDAHVVIEGEDFDAAKEAARKHAEGSGALYVEDGKLGPIAEGAGTIAIELSGSTNRLDAIFVPLGNGALVNGVGTWFKHFSPKTEVIAVCAAEAPSMQMSWKAGRPVTAPSTTIADGIAVRVPVPEAVEIMSRTVDDVMLVSDDEIVQAMRATFATTGLIVEPAGAAGVAAVAQRRDALNGKTVATILTGGNVTDDQLKRWYY